MVTYILQNGGSWIRSCQCQAFKKKKKNHGYTSQLKAGDPSKLFMYKAGEENGGMMRGEFSAFHISTVH